MVRLQASSVNSSALLDPSLSDPPGDESAVLLIGYYGFGNAGDEAILASILGSLREDDPDISCCVSSGDPEATAKCHNVRGIHWQDDAGLIEAARGVRLIILGGGGLFHDYWGFDPDAVLSDHHWGLSYFASAAVLAVVCQKPLVMHGVGVGPLLSEHGKRYTRFIADCASAITVRDAASKDCLVKLGVPAGKVVVGADPAFTFPTLVPSDASPDSSVSHKSPSTIGVSLRSWRFGVDQSFWEREVARTLDVFAERHDVRYVFLPFQSSEDEESSDTQTLDRVRGLMGSAKRVDQPTKPMCFSALQAAISKCDFVLGMRLHSLVFSATQGVPFLGIVYDEKVCRVFDDGPFRSCLIPLHGLQYDELLPALSRQYQERTKRKAELAPFVNQQREGCRRAFKVVDSYLHTPKEESSVQLPEVFRRLITSRVLDASRYRQSLQTVRREADSAQQTVDRLTQVILQNTDEYARLSKEMASSADRTTLLEENVVTLEGRNAQLQAALSELESSREELRLANERLRETIAGSDERVTFLQESVVTGEGRSAQLQAALSELESSREGFRLNNERLRETIADSDERVTLLEESVAALDGCNAQMRGELAELESSREGLRLDNERLRESLAASESQSRRLASDLQSAADRDHVTIRDLRNNLRLSSRELIVAQERSRLPDPSGRSVSDLAKRQLHLLLDLGQAITPEFLRRPVRKIYLKWFYYRVFPQARSHPQILPTSPATTETAVAHSQYRPLLLLKEGMYTGLPLSYSSGKPLTLPLVSVVLPVYNGEQYIARAIESILSQEYGKFELIVVDDGSTDRTPEILERFLSDERVRVIRQENRKLPAALSEGFRHVSGDLYTWTSADNLMKPECLRVLTEFLISRPDVEMVYANQELIDEHGAALCETDFCPGYQVPPESAHIHWPPDPGELIFVQNNYMGACFLYRAWAGRILGDYQDQCFGFEDYEYWMRMDALFRIAHLGRADSLYRYRLHPDSLSAREKQLRIIERVRSFMDIEAARHEVYLDLADITLVGSHPWFSSFESLYRNAGHNIFSWAAIDSDSSYRYRITRSSSKAVAIAAIDGLCASGKLPQFVEALGPDCLMIAIVDSAEILVQSAVSLDRFDWFLSSTPQVWRELEKRGIRKYLEVHSAESVAYPLLAVVNNYYGNRLVQDRHA